MININIINSIYIENKNTFDKIRNNIIKNIDGRICHHNIIILNLICSYLDIKNYLEIGVHNGASMSYVVSSNKKINCYGIDLFENTFGHYKKDKISINKSLDNINKNNMNNSNISLIKGNSRDITIKNNLLSKLNEELIDLLFIDGDHGYSGVQSDFNTYSPIVKSGGIIILDDYNRKWPDVIKFAKTIDTNLYKNIGLFLNNELILQKV